MSYKTFLAYYYAIDQLKAEEALVDLQIASEPKPVFDIDFKECTNKGIIGRLEKHLRGVISDKQEDTIPYYLDETVDHAGIAKLKEQLQGNQKRG